MVVVVILTETIRRHLCIISYGYFVKFCLVFERSWKKSFAKLIFSDLCPSEWVLEHFSNPDQMSVCISALFPHNTKMYRKMYENAWKMSNCRVFLVFTFKYLDWTYIFTGIVDFAKIWENTDQKDSLDIFHTLHITRMSLY